MEGEAAGEELRRNGLSAVGLMEDGGLHSAVLTLRLTPWVCFYFFLSF